MDYRTRIVHTGKDTDPFTGAASVPIYQVSTFAQEDPARPGPYEYARGTNPTREAVEHAIAVLEGGEVGLAFSSGMAAISSVLLLFQPGDHLVVSQDVYGGTYRVLTTLFRRWGLEVTFVDSSDPEQVEKAVRRNTRALYVETPSNPLLKITDLKAVVEIARRHGLLTIIDNTFMTPYLQRPLALGFDIVIHSATKFLGGHSDLIAGLVVTADEKTGKKLKFIQNAFGAILGPQDSWLLLRGMKTLAVRMEAQQAGAAKIARWLKERKGIKAVYYPGLEEHPGYEIHRRQAAGGGAVLAFELPGREKVLRFMRAVKLPLKAVSLGGVESILSYPATMSHAAVPPEERRRLGIGDGLVRLSVGLEAPEDLQEDLERALQQAGVEG